MSIVEIKQHADQKMQQSLDAFKSGLTKIRTGRARVRKVKPVGTLKRPERFRPNTGNKLPGNKLH